MPSVRLCEEREWIFFLSSCGFERVLGGAVLYLLLREQEGRHTLKRRDGVPTLSYD